MYLRDDDAGWMADSPEYRCAAFEEGMATYLGSVGLYSHTTPDPYYCLSDVACSATSSSSFSMEASSLLNGGCSSTRSRWAITNVRYLWDIYDDAAENAFLVADTLQRPFAEIVDVLTAIPSGTSNHQSDEPWDAAKEQIDMPDGRSATDDFGYRFHLETGVDDYSAHTLNCDP